MWLLSQHVQWDNIHLPQGYHRYAPPPLLKHITMGHILNIPGAELTEKCWTSILNISPLEQGSLFCTMDLEVAWTIGGCLLWCGTLQLAGCIIAHLCVGTLQTARRGGCWEMILRLASLGCFPICTFSHLGLFACILYNSCRALLKLLTLIIHICCSMRPDPINDRELLCLTICHRNVSLPGWYWNN